MTRMKCPLCNQEIDTYPHENMTYRSYECPCCGWFILRDFPQSDIALIKNEAASYFYFTGNQHFIKKGTHRINYVGGKEYFESDEFKTRYPNSHFITKEEILAFYPKAFNERVTHILLGLAKQSKFLGDSIQLTREEMISALFIKRYSDENSLLNDPLIGSQAGAIINYLENNRLVDAGGGMSSSNSIKLLPEGWKRVDELQQHNSHNKDIFVSMAFNDGTKETREAIRTGIIRAGYSPEFIDEIIHNHQIMPEMFRLIRECRFLIMDVTDPNFGAYYEAGYALGLGKEVIITCREQEFHDTTNKPHFDIAQKQILVWKDYEDLTERLSEWIKAIAGSTVY